MDDENDFADCQHCDQNAPLNKYYHCPECDREIFPEDDEVPDL